MSHVVVDRETGKAIVEIWDDELAKKVNPKYKVVPILEWLQSLNKKVDMI